MGYRQQNADSVRFPRFAVWTLCNKTSDKLDYVVAI